ncbi:AfsR/SARP family transcriptional regulator [Streptomyces sulphureus]|uniref:AfsR/SARP family transcriptional regulator n=1 Tax=Streptomyces sulphureus TaxID=47758 RepID=UPI00037D67E7|nr:AfsR/SARP family transcriptional regulator [Streptomyces sulphureus]
MKIDLLGPLALAQDGVSYLPTAKKTRKVLALLLLQLGQAVSVDSLLEELWAGDPPTSALTTVQTYVLQLRTALTRALGIPRAEVAAHHLVTEPGGYRFELGSADLDLVRFRAKAEQARLAYTSGALQRAAPQFHEALKLWKGAALSNVPTGPLLSVHKKRLEEERLSMLEQRVATDLWLGHHRNVLGELTALVEQHPTNETLHGLFMIALYRSGRRAQALEVFHQLRTYLVSTLGLEPSSKIHELQRAVLSSDSRLDPPR